MNHDFHLLHRKYLLKLKRNRLFVVSIQLLILILFTAIWQISSQREWIDPLLFSSPARIGKYIFTGFKNATLYIHIYTTVYETVIAFLISTIVATVIAALLWWNRTLSKILDPFLVVLNAMPKVAIGPIIIVIFGANITSVIAMGVIISVIVATLVIYESFKSTEPNYIRVMETFGATKSQVFFKCVFPSSYPTIISTLKVSVGLAWVGIIVGEFLVSKEGVGYLIVYGFQVFDFTLVLSSVVLILFFAAIMYYFVERIEYFLLRKK